MTTGIGHRARRLRGALRRLRGEAYERPHLRAFQAFHDGLAERRDAVYMFFTGNLLHWVSRALRFVPSEVNLILLGSDLAADERAWVEGRGRPCHFLTERFDDNTVLDFIFRTARHNFAWLHVDCFVFNPALFGEMLSFAPDVAMNCIWSHPGPLETMHSAFVAIQHAVLAAVRRRVAVSPATYHYEGGATGRTVSRRPLYSRVPSARHLDLLGRLAVQRGTQAAAAPPPAYPVGDCFEILELYQLVANALGYRLHKVRGLSRPAGEHYSNEILHVNGVSTYKRYKHAAPGKSYIDAREYQLLLQADYALARAMGEGAPPRYRRLRDELGQEVAELGLDGEQVARNLTGFLMSQGVSRDNCTRILAAA